MQDSGVNWTPGGANTAGPHNAALERYWSDFQRYWYRPLSQPSSTSLPFYEVFRFGATEASANTLAALVVSGIKTATSDLLWSVEQDQKLLVKVGDFSIVTDWDQRPVCLIQTTQVCLLPFKEVDAQFAYDYGEGERTLEWWNRELWHYCQDECRRIRRVATPDMPLVCERFRVVYS